MLQFHRAPLVFRQLCQRLGQVQQLFLAHRALTGRGLIGRKPGFEAQGGILQGRLQGAFLGCVALGPAESPEGIGDTVGEHLPEPACQFRIALASELVLLATCFQECLLNHVGWIELGLKLIIQV